MIIIWLQGFVSISATLNQELKLARPPNCIFSLLWKRHLVASLDHNRYLSSAYIQIAVAQLFPNHTVSLKPHSSSHQTHFLTDFPFSFKSLSWSVGLGIELFILCVGCFCDSPWLKNLMTESTFSALSIMEILTPKHMHLFHFQSPLEFAYLWLLSSVARILLMRPRLWF